jgi:hypothetical protein
MTVIPLSRHIPVFRLGLPARSIPTTCVVLLFFPAGVKAEKSISKLKTEANRKNLAHSKYTRIMLKYPSSLLKPPNKEGKRMSRFLIRGTIFLSLILNTTAGTSWAWNDQTHLAIAKAAGYPHWYNAAGADITKIKAGTIEEKNHYFDNDHDVEVTAKTALDQANRYNNPSDEEGHLYGAIISSLREFKTTKSVGKYAEYHMAFAAHYIGDLSQPLHNISYDSFNKAHHSINDGIVEGEVLDKIGEIQKNMYEIKLRPSTFEEDLANEIARIAKVSRMLGLKLRAENRDMTQKEAYAQLGHSASLLKAVLKGMGKK